MQIRYPFAGAFVGLALIAAYLGLGTQQIPQVNDKILHFVAFFLLTLTFYWIFDTTRRRVLNLTLSTVTGLLGLGSEGVQTLLTDRAFDVFDIAANILGSLGAVGLCTVYHKRMLDRKRKAKGYNVVPQDGHDIEMGDQDMGVVENDDEPTSNDVGGIVSTTDDLHDVHETK